MLGMAWVPVTITWIVSKSNRKKVKHGSLTNRSKSPRGRRVKVAKNKQLVALKNRTAMEWTNLTPLQRRAILNMKEINQPPRDAGGKRIRKRSRDQTITKSLPKVRQRPKRKKEMKRS